MAYIISSGDTSSGITLKNDSMTVLEGGTANDTTVNYGGRLYVSSSGIANDTLLNYAGGVCVHSGGTAVNTMVTSDSWMDVDYGGTVNSTKIYSSGCVYLSGTANSTAVNYWGHFYVLSGGVADNTRVSFHSFMYVDPRAVADHTKVDGGGYLYVSRGGTANDTTLSGFMYVSYGGTANNTVISGGSLFVSSGGTANNIHWTPCEGHVYVYDGAFVTYASQYSGVYYGSNDHLLSHAMEMNGMMIGSSNEMNVMTGGKAHSATVNAVGSMTVSSGGTANSATVNSGGSMIIKDGGTALEIRENGGAVYIDDNAEVTFVSNSFSGIDLSRNATIHSGTTANSTTVNDYGYLMISSGGIANDTTVESGGFLEISSGGRITGQTTLLNGAYVTTIEGSIVDFDISELAPGSDVRLNNLSLISGWTYATLTLTVDGEQAPGSYKLADGAAGFNCSITVKDTDGAILGYIAVNDPLTVSDRKYSLSLAGSVMSVSIESSTEPPAPVVVSKFFLSSGTRVVGADKKYVSTEIGYEGILKVASGGRSESSVVCCDLEGYYGYAELPPTGQEIVLSGGYALRTDVSYGSQLVYGLTSRTYLSNVEMLDSNALYYDIPLNGSQVVLSGGTALTTIIDGGGRQLVMSSGLADDTCVYRAGAQYVSAGGVARNTTLNTYGYQYVESGGVADGIYNSSGRQFISSGGKLTGKITFVGSASAYLYSGSILDFDLTQTSAGAEALVNSLWVIQGSPLFTLTVDGTQADGVYSLAGGASSFKKTVTVVDTSGNELGTLTVGEASDIDGTTYTLNLDDGLLSVAVESAMVVTAARGDRDGNGVSDVMFVWTGNNYAHGYWMNGTSEWWSANSTGVSADWDNLGSYDMSGDGKADAVMFGNVVVNDAKGAYIGYYQDGDDANGWVNIGFLDNSDNVAWKNAVGNLTGGTANSIVWYAPDLYAMGAWTDGTDTWVTLSNSFGGAEWALVGCGDFDGDGKDSVVMSYNGGQIFYTVNLDGAGDSLGSLNWSGWDVRAIGDFAGDGKDDIVLFHAETGSMVMLANGSADDYTSIGQLDPNDWFVAGCGDYNGDGADDLLVRQYSTGMLGYYSNGDTTKWVELGRGVDMDWTVIA